MWHWKNKSIIHASTKHYSSLAKSGFAFTVGPTHTIAHVTCIMNVSTVWIAIAGRCYLGIHTTWEAGEFLMQRSIVAWSAGLYAVGGCDGMDQVRNTNRWCHEVNENLQWACRKAVQYIGMCHNAWIRQRSLQPCTRSLSLSRSVIPLCIHLSFCLSNSGSPFLFGSSPVLPSRAFSRSRSHGTLFSFSPSLDVVSNLSIL